MTTPVPKHPALAALAIGCLTVAATGLSPQAPGTFMDDDPSPLPSEVLPEPPGTHRRMPPSPSGLRTPKPSPSPHPVGTVPNPRYSWVPQPEQTPTPTPEP